MKQGCIGYEALLSYTGQVLRRFGYSDDQAAISARILVEADARGVPSHGVARLSFYESNITNGAAFPQAEPEIVHETPLSLVVDGHNGIGPYIADFTMSRVIAKAKNLGAGFGAVRNSNHFGMAGLWAEMATAEGFMGMSFCTTRKTAIPTFGRERIMGTNPVCFAIPSSGRTHFMLDMATTVVSRGKVEVYERRDRPMPVGWVVDETGADSTDPHHLEKLFRSDLPHGGHLFLGGAGEELGGHKGFGLGLLVEVLCAGMSMGGWSRDTFGPDGAGIACFLGAIRTDLFGDAKEIADHVESILEGVRQSAKAEGHERIYIHGEKEAEARAKSLQEGVFLDDATWDILNKYAAKFGLEAPAAEPAAG
jgi:LDH2 family malate/lactate/ureidoglycolate dehydrogenase